MSEHYALVKDGEKIAIYTHDSTGLTAARAKMAELVNVDYVAAQGKYGDPEYVVSVQSPNDDISGVRIQHTKSKPFDIPCDDVTQTPICVYKVNTFTNVA